MSRLTALALPAALLLACGADPADSADALNATDLRFDVPAMPTGGLQWVMPEALIEPYTDTMACYVDSYQGETVGVSAIETYQAQGYGHHVLFWTGEVDPDLYPDGSVFDCTDPRTMSAFLPFFIVQPDREADGATIASAKLPEGMGIGLDSGTRFIIQMHYLNTTGETLRVRDVVNFSVMPESSVEVWAAPWGHGITSMPLPPGEETTIAFDCDWPSDVNLLNVFGHMHQYGTKLSLDHTNEAGTSRLYDVPTWTAEYSDTPPATNFDLPGYPVKAGDVFRTSCTWFNDTDRTLDYPDEMCATTGIAYPSRVSMYCNPRPVE